MKTIKTLLVTAGCAVFATGTAVSQTLTATLLNVDPGLTIRAAFDGSTFRDLRSGLFAFDRFHAFCVEPDESIAFGETVIYDIQDPATLADFDIISRLIGGYWLSDQSDLEAAAVQLAIWEVVAETSATYSLLAGNVLVDPAGGHGSDTLAAAGRADFYLNNLSAFPPAEFVYLTNETRQDMIVIPEPGPIALLALSGLVLVRRRRSA